MSLIKDERNEEKAHFKERGLGFANFKTNNDTSPISRLAIKKKLLVFSSRLFKPHAFCTTMNKKNEKKKGKRRKK